VTTLLKSKKCKLNRRFSLKARLQTASQLPSTLATLIRFSEDFAKPTETMMRASQFSEP
jgi:hypothetical protein